MRARSRFLLLLPALALLSLAMLTGLAPEADAQNRAPISLEYTQDNPTGRADEGDAVEFTVRRVGDTSQELTVNVRIEGKSDPQVNRFNPTNADDFDSSMTTSSLTFAAGSTDPQTITVQTKRDTTYEPHERFDVVASGTYGGADFEVRLEGRLFDAVKPTVGLTYTAPFRITEGDKGTVTFRMSHLVPHPVSVSYSIMSRHTTSTETVGDGGATMADHNVTSGTVTIPADTGTATFDVQTVEDLIPEPDEQFVVMFEVRGHTASFPHWNPIDRFTSGNRKETVVVTIVDDDTPQPQQRLLYLHGTVPGGLTGATRATLDEGEEANLTVTLVGEPPTTDVSIPLKFTGFPAGEATSSDYRIPASVTIKSGQKSGSVTLQIVDDTSDERYRELLAVEIDDSAASWPQGYTKGDRSRFEAVMRDNDGTSASLQSLSRAALTEAAGARTATFQIKISRRPKGDVTGTAPFAGVSLAEGGALFVLGYTGTAQRGPDYNSSGTRITIPEGSASLPRNCSASGGAVTCTVTLTVIDDNLYEGGSGTTESVKIDLDVRNSRFNDGIARAAGYRGLSLTIEDNDTQPTFSIASVSGSEAGNLTFTVTRSGALGNDVSVTAATGSHVGATNPATAGADYTAKTESLRFEANDTQKTFQVEVTDDSIDEPDETFAVTLSRPVDNDRLPAPGIAAGGGTAVGTLTDDDAAPTALTLSVDADTGTNAVQDSIAENGGAKTVRVTARITSATTFSEEKTVTVKVGKAADTATEGTDYTEVTDQTITIAAGQTSATVDFELTPTNDTRHEADETISIEGELTGVTVTHTSIKLTSEDAAPTALTLSVDADTGTNAVQDSIAENGGAKTVRVTATLGGTTQFDTAKDVTVKVGKAADTATEGTDYTEVTDKTITIAAGQTSATVDFTLTPTQDVIDEADETISIEGELAGVTVTPTSIKLTDDDAAPTALTLSVDADTGTNAVQDSIAENGGAKTVRVTARITSATTFSEEKTVTVKVGKAADTATEGTDYTEVTDQTITIAAGQTSATVDFELTPTNDTRHEADETISIEGELTGVTVTHTSIKLTSEDAAPTALTLSVDADTGTNAVQDSIAENGGAKTVRVTATLGGTTQFDTAKDVTVKVGKAADTATEGTDYTEVTDKTITIAAGQTSATVDFTLTPTQDVIDEADETISIEGELAGVTVTPTSIKLTDDDAAPTALTLSVDADTGTNAVQDSIAENGGAKTVRVTARITSATTFSEEKTVTVKVGKAADTATEGTDYTEVTDQTITIAAGQTSATVDFELTPTNDTRHEADETISIEGELTGVTVTHTSIKLTSEDAAPTALTLSVDADTGTNAVQDSIAENGGAKTVRVTATLGGTTQFDTAKDVTVKVGKAADTATEGTDYTEVTDKTITIAAGQTSATVDFTLTPTQDVIDEADETISIEGELAGVTVTPTSIKLTDDDAAPTALTLSVDADTGTNAVQDSIAENGGAKTVRVTARITSATTFSEEKTVTVKVGKAADTATEGTDYTEVTDQTITIAAGQTSATVDFELTPTNDTRHEADETISIEGELTGVTVTHTSIKLTSEDAAPTALTLSVDADTGTNAVQDSIAENGGAKTVRVTATLGGTTQFDTAKDVTVKVGKAADTATEGTDYTEVTDKTITIAAGQTSATVDFTLTPTQDVIDEADETISIEGELAGVTVTPTSIKLTDDDAAPTALTLSVDADTGTNAVQDSIAENGGAKTVRVTARITSATTFSEEKTVTVKVGKAADTATEGTDYTEVTDQTITIAAGQTSATVDFELTPTNDTRHEADETISIEGELTGVTVTHTSIKLTSEDAAPTALTLSVDADTGTNAVQDSIAENGGAKTVRVTATLGGTTQFDTAKDVTVKVGKAADTATEGTDYTEVTDKTITIAAGQTSATVDFTLTPTQDVIDEADETISIEGELAGVTVTPTSIKLTDDDAAPTALTLSVDADTGTNAVQDSIAENGGAKTVRVTARITSATTFSEEKTVTVKVGKAADTATEGTDYTEVTDQTITIAAGQTSATVDFELTPTNDTRHEADETISIEGELTGVTVTHTSIKLTSEDAAPTALTLSVDADTGTNAVQDSIAENGGAKTVRVTATLGGTTQFDTAKDVTVKVGKAADTATEGTDYTEVTDKTITIAAGQTSATVDFTLTPTQDVIDEADETISIEGELAGVTVTPTSIKLTDDDAAPTALTLSVDADTGTNAVQDSIAENGGAKTVRVTARITSATTFSEEKTVTVKVGKAADTATEGTDYTEVTDQTITIAAGQTSATVDFELTPTNDTRHEADETISIEGELTGVTVTHTSIKLTSEDAAPTALTLSVDADTGTNAVQDSIAENGGAKTVRVTATLGGTTQFDTAKDVTVKVGKAADTATEGTDYTEVTDKTITIAAGQTSATVDFTLTPTQDVIDEADETISIEGELAGVTVTPTSIKLTDDDAAPTALTLSVDADTGTNAVQDSIAENGGAKTVRVTARITSATTFSEEKTVTVKVGKAADTATEGTDYTEVTDQTITIAAGQTSATVDFELTPTNDTRHEADETISIEGELTGVTVTHTSIKLTSEDAAPTALTLSVDADTGTNAVQDSIAENGGAKTVRVTATLGGTTQFDTAKDVTVKVGKAADTATEGTDYTEVTDKTITIAAGQTSATVDFTLTPTQDVIDEADETISIEGELAGVTVTPTSIKLTDDDAAPTALTLSVDADTGTNAVQDSIAENGGAKTVRVTARITSATTFSEEKTVTVKVGKAADTATEGTDYTEVTDQTITIAAGQTSATVDFELTPTNDTRHEADETISIEGELTGVTVTHTSIKLTSEDAAPTALTLSVDADTGTNAVQDSIAENGGAKTVRVTATLGGTTQFDTAKDVTVKVGKAADTATEGTDYTEVTDKTITIAAGQTSATVDFTLTPTQDVIDEADETISIEGELAGVTVTPTSIKLTDDDAAPTALTLSVDADTGTNAVQDSIAENGGAKTVRVTARITSATTFSEEKTVTVKVGKAADTATEGTDYTEVTDQTITIAAGQTSATVDFELTPTNDTRHEADETISIEGELTGVTVTHTSIKLTSEDAAPTALTLSVDADTGTNAVQDSIAENGGAKTVRVTATLGGTTQFDTAKDVTVKVGKAADTATEGTDYTEVTDKTITIAAGQTSATVDFTLTPTQDVIDEADETISIEGELAGVTVTPTSIKLTDDDAAPTALTLSVDADTGTNAVQDSIAENGGAKTVRVTARITSATTFSEEKTVTVKVGKAADTATEGTDYTEVTDQTITIAAGQTSATVDFELTPTNDTRHEADETISIEGELTGVTVTHTSIKLTSEDAAPTALTLSVDADTGTNAVQDSIAENGGAKTVRVTATLGGTTQFDTAKDVTVKVGKAADTATEGTDYTEVTDKTITIAAGQTSATVDFTLTPTQDVIDEADETISIEGELAGVTVTPTSIKLTDDDAAPTALTLSVDADTGTNAVQDSIAENGGAKTVRVTARITSATTFSEEKTVTVKVGKAADTATEGTDYTEVTDQTITIAAGQTSATVDFELTPTNDTRHEADETISIEGELTGVTVTHTSIKLTSEDAAPTALTLSVDADTGTNAVQDSIAENGGAKTVRVTATLGGTTQFDTAKDVTVKVGKAADTATEGTDYTEVTDKTITIAAGQTSATVDFTLTPTQDVIDEADETISIEGELAGVTVTPTSIKLTDDDAAPTALTLSVDADTGTNAVQDSIAENGGAKTVRVTARITSATTFSEEKTVTVKVGKAADTATEGTDYTEVTDQTITIAAGQTSATVDFELTPTNDTRHEADETISIEGELTGVTVTHTSIKLTSEDAAPTALTLSVDADTGTNAVQDSIAENGGAKTVRVTATLGGTTQFDTAKDVTVKVGKAADTATEGTDYTEVTDKTITIAAGQTSATVDFTLTPTQDVIDEADETISIEGELAGVTVTPTSIKLTDDDAAPTALTLSVDADTGTNAVQDSIAENGGAKTVRVTARITSATTFSEEKTVTVKVGKAADTATEGTDYTEVTDQTITIAAGQTSATVDFELTPTNDTRHEADETISIEGELTGVTVTHTSIKLTSEDAAPTALTLSVDADTGTNAVQDSIAENGGAKTVRVTATLGGTTQFDTAKDVTVKVGKAADTATEGTDYTEVTDKTITIAAGQTSATVDFTLTPTQDVIDEADETISIEGELAGVTVTPTSIKLTDDDAAPTALTLSVDADTGTNAVQDSIAENGGAKTVRVTARITSATTFSEEKTVTVKVGKAADTATEGTDYTEVTDQTITIAAGQTSATVDFELTPTNDTRHEADETISIEGELTGVTVTHTSIKLTSEDAAPTALTLSVDADTGTNAVQDSIAENGGAKTVRVTATLGGTTQFDTAKDVTVKVGKAADTATEGTDYTEVTDKTITIAAGQTSATVDFTLTPTQDVIDEADETISIEGELAGVTVTPTSIKLTDDDAAPTALTLTLSVDADTGVDGTQTSVAEGGGAKTVRVTATLGGTTQFDTAKDVTVKVGKAADTATEGTDYTEVTDKTITIAAGQTSATVDFELTPTQDVIDEADETISIEGELTGVTVTGTTVKIIDDDVTLIPGKPRVPGNYVEVVYNGSNSVITLPVPYGLGDDPVVVGFSFTTKEYHPVTKGDFDCRRGADIVNKALEIRNTVVHNRQIVVYRTLPKSTPSDIKYVDIPIRLCPGSVGKRFEVAWDTNNYFTIDGRRDQRTSPFDSSAPNCPARHLCYTEAVIVSELSVQQLPMSTPEVNVTETSGATEGGNAAFIIKANPPPTTDLSVSVTVTAAGDYGVGTGDRKVIIPTSGEATLTIVTTDDEVDEPDGSVTITLNAEDGYTVGALSSGKVTIVDDDDDDPLPVLSVADVTAREGVDWLVPFTVRLSAPAAHAVEVRVDTRPSDPLSAQPGPDYYPVPVGGHRLVFRAGETEKTVRVLVLDDSHDEDAETFEFVLSEAKGATIGDGVAVGTIVNDDPMPAAWLSRFGRSVAEQALDGIAGRMSAPRTVGVQGAIAGQAVDFNTPSGDAAGSSGSNAPAMADLELGFGSGAATPFGDRFGPGFGDTRFSAPSAQYRTMTVREALLGSSFTQTGEKDASGGSLAFWGRAAQGSFDGREGTFSLDGEVTTGLLGADYTRGKWLVGLALARSAGAGEYRDTYLSPRPASQSCPGEAGPLCGEAVRAGDGKIESSLTAAIPYASFLVSEHLKLWGAAGYGAGDVTLKTAMDGSYSADTTWSMAAAGLRGGLLKGGDKGFGLSVLADALWARTDSEKTGELAASRSETNRLRLGIEGSREFRLESGMLTPRLEFGVRHDGGDADTGFGVEVGGGVSLTARRLGLVLDVSGRALLAHEAEDFRDRGISASLTYDPDPGSKRGASFALRRNLGGSATGGLDALFAADPLEKRTGSEATSRWTAEAAWGFPVFGGRFTGSPFLAWGFSAGARDYDAGWRLEPEAPGAPDLSLSLKATRREGADDTTDHGVGIDLTARW